MPKPKYSISQDNKFVIEGYNAAPTFASFFPGIAGIYGCPLWVFYTNRGQCITSAGVHDKDRAIIEFQPANKAYRYVCLSGFRTFLKVDGKFYEPFREGSDNQQEMRINSHDLIITETNHKLKIKVEVNYFTIPNEQFPGLARVVKVTSLANKKRQLEIIDGLPVFIPYGFNNDLLKRLSQTIEAWSIVQNLDNGAPFYKLKVAPADISETTLIDKGNFYLSSLHQGGKDQRVNLIVDPALVFGENKSLEDPAAFIAAKSLKVPAKQQTDGFMPAAFSHKRTILKPKETIELDSVLGQADSLSFLNKVKTHVTGKKYFDQKVAENKELIDSICSMMDIQSAARNFDLYARQTFLDNVMRGGLPINLGNKIMYLYYRKHGDMERDYNDFKLMPTYFSQGNGNYRDINQNRRNDIFFNPDLAEDNILRFYNLIQLDGFNPLVVFSSKFFVKSQTVAEKIINKHVVDPPPWLLAAVSQPFMLGSLLKTLDEIETKFKTSKQDLAQALINAADIEESAVHHEGFWIDHFSYNTDLLESFACIYPERVQEILFDKKVFYFYDNEHVAVDRPGKYRLVGDIVRQYHSVQPDAEKTALLNSRPHSRNIVRTKNGTGKIYHTNLMVKLLSIIANKVASFDGEGIGLEMEADKPDWYDALNGLPALLGSSLSETLELKRLALYVQDHLSGNVKLKLPIEIKEYIDRLVAALEIFEEKADSFEYWRTSYDIKEDFRRRTKLGIDGDEFAVDAEYARAFLALVIDKCDYGIKKCLKKYKNYYTYFINEVAEFVRDGEDIQITKIDQKPLPLFLEGFVHALKVEKDKKVYPLVKNGPLYDKKLKMYKVNASLEKTPIEIGRARIFTPGWLENESIWLHMEYKYMLELLKAGMYDEFFTDFKKVMIPYLDPKVYKRSILENSSFLASSANPNKANHGRGFVARLSGGAAEFIDIWIHMTTGKNIFALDKKGKLTFKLSPILPAWLFAKGELSFRLLGSIDVTYINKAKKNTYNGGVKPVAYKLVLENKEIQIDKPYIPEPYASMIRDRKVKKIDVTLG
jgi:hypothetical protein